MNSVLKLATKSIEELSEPHVKSDGTQHTKARLREVLKEKWTNKVMHGHYIRNIHRQLISEEDTFLWLSKGDLKAETESEIVAAQDQVLQTKYLHLLYHSVNIYSNWLQEQFCNLSL